MGNRIKGINLGLILLIVLAGAGTAYESYQCWKINRVNQAVRSGQTVSDDAFLYQKKFTAAYLQGNDQDYKHAVQTYSQLLEITTGLLQQAKIQYNIGNNLFLSGLQRGVKEDGTLKDEAKYDFSQARVAYEQALRLNPLAVAAKFNLSLLLSVTPQNMKPSTREQTGVELSNIPIGLP
jgi:mxaK protein